MYTLVGSADWLAHPGTVGRPLPTFEVFADGQRASPQLEAEILAFARPRLASYQVPRSIDFEAALPRHPTRKLHTRLLREHYWKDRGRRI